MRGYLLIGFLLVSVSLGVANAGSVGRNGEFSVAGATVHYAKFPLSSVRVAIIGPEPSDSDRDNFLTDKASRRPGLLAMVNGGYLRSFAPPRPLGLVRVNGRNLSSPNSTWLGDGMICMNNKQIVISAFRQEEVSKNRDCLQSAPVIISKGLNRYSPMSSLESGEMKLVEARQEQSFVCVDKNNNIILGFSEKIALKDLVPALISNLSCESAIRMSGHDTAGLVIGTRLYGNTDLQIHNAIGVFSR
jgi:hypothetical protein